MESTLLTNKQGGKPVAMSCLGEIITMHQLLPPQTRRWVAKRKFVVASAVLCGLLSKEEVLARYPNLSTTEIEYWVATVKVGGGLNGLKQKHVREHNPSLWGAQFLEPANEFAILEAGGLVLCGEGTIGALVSGEERTVKLTRHEFKLVSYLMCNRGVVIPRAVLFRYLYPQEDAPEMKILGVFVAKIRRRLKMVFGEGYGLIKTAWGRGYYIS